MNKNINTYRAGYIFKPTHNEIHYIKKGATGDLRSAYTKNFTTNKSEAVTSENIEKAKSVIVGLVEKFPDDEYTYTPVIVSVASNTFKRFLNGKWLDEEIKVDSQIE